MRKLINIFFFLLLFVFFIIGIFWRGLQIKKYFSTTDNSQRIMTSITPSGPIGKELSDRVINGDKKAYSKVMSLELGNSKDFGPHALGYSIIMANKYKCSNACHNIYADFYMLYKGNQDSLKKCLDPKTKEMVRYFLNKGEVLGNDYCSSILEDFN